LPGGGAPRFEVAPSDSVSALEPSWISLIRFRPLERPVVDRPCFETFLKGASEARRLVIS